MSASQFFARPARPYVGVRQFYPRKEGIGTWRAAITTRCIVGARDRDPPARGDNWFAPSHAGRRSPPSCDPMCYSILSGPRFVAAVYERHERPFHHRPQTLRTGIPSAAYPIRIS